MTRRIHRFLPFLYCVLFTLSLLGCAAPMAERRASWSLLPTSAEVEADKVRLAIPRELRARLNAITVQSCKAASNTRPARQLIGQTYRDPIGESRDKMLIALLKWGVEQAYEKTPEERAALLQARQMVPPPPVEWQPSVPVPEAEAPRLIEHPIVQFSEGTVAGGALGAVPFGPAAAEVAIELRLLPKGTYWARVGKACGEIVVGTGQIILGCAGMGAGVGMSGTGGGAAVGVPVVIGSVAIAANGCATAGHGLAELHPLLRDGDVPSESPAPAPGQWVLKKAAEKPTQPTVAAATPPAKPATPPTTPQQTTTKTVYKDSSGKPIKTVTKKGETITTTREKPSATGTQAKSVATTNGHHPWPKYLGGPAKQDLAKLPEPLHKAYHSGLDKILPRQRGTSYYDNLSPQAKQQLIRDLAAYTNAFDAKYGTRLYDSMLRNGFPAP